jgi:AcrR family transcriptional regulator
MAHPPRSHYYRSGDSGKLYGVDTPLVKSRMSAKRSPRSDALENRERVLDAAEHVLSEKGASASTEDVAARAGVGIGTVFRHFATKNELLEGVLARVLERLAQTARDHLEGADPGAAFFAVLEHVVEQAPLKKAVASGLSGAGLEIKRRAAAGPLRAALAELLRRAQKAKAVRSDVGVEEVMAMVIAASRAAEHAGRDRGLQKRSVGIILDGLRPR